MSTLKSPLPTIVARLMIAVMRRCVSGLPDETVPSAEIGAVLANLARLGVDVRNGVIVPNVEVAERVQSSYVEIHSFSPCRILSPCVDAMSTREQRKGYMVGKFLLRVFYQIPHRTTTGNFRRPHKKDAEL